MSQNQNHEHEEVVVGKYYFRKDCPNKLVLVLEIDGESVKGQVLDIDSGEIFPIIIARQGLIVPPVTYAKLVWIRFLVSKRIENFFGIVVADKG